jgi:hypothetical protein
MIWDSQKRPFMGGFTHHRNLAQPPLVDLGATTPTTLTITGQGGQPPPCGHDHLIRHRADASRRLIGIRHGVGDQLHGDGQRLHRSDLFRNPPR